MNKFQILEDSVRNTFGRVMWSHKIQEKQADILPGLSSQIMWANIILASFTSAGVVSTVFLDRYWMKLASALVSFLSAAPASQHDALARQVVKAFTQITVIVLRINRGGDVARGELHIRLAGRATIQRIVPTFVGPVSPCVHLVHHQDMESIQKIRRVGEHVIDGRVATSPPIAAQGGDLAVLAQQLGPGQPRDQRFMP